MKLKRKYNKSLKTIIKQSEKRARKIIKKYGPKINLHHEIKRGPGRPRKTPGIVVGYPLGPVTHQLKTWPQYFAESFSGEKTFEIRQNDRNFQRWDYLVLEEWNPETEKYTGRVLSRRIDYIITGPKFGLKQGWVAMGLSKV